MIIRELSEKDFEKWLQLRYELWPYHTLGDLRNEMVEIYKRYKTDYMFYIAEENNDMIGFIELSIHDTAIGCLTNNVCFIEGWYVKPEYRQKGVGRSLVNKAESWAIGIGCKEMASDTTEQYPISPIAHKAIGFNEVDKPLNYKKILISD